MTGLLRLAALILAAITMCAACGETTSELVVTVAPPTDGPQRLDDVSRLDVRAFTVDEVTEQLAEAVNPDGTPVTGVSCDAVLRLAPSATGCSETEQTVLRDVDLLHQGDVPPDGIVRFERPASDVRIYVELPGDQLRVDDDGRICRWNGRTIVDADAATAIIDVVPAC